uniref:Uncharacterized protein n=3 Tax=Rhizophora mucronata TaxID=61149 RepID=A0A2P2K528_RHIMU
MTSRWCLSAPVQPFSIYSQKKNTMPLLSLPTLSYSYRRLQQQQQLLCCTTAPSASSSLGFFVNPRRFSSEKNGIGDVMISTKKKKKKGRGSGAVCYAAPLTSSNLQWISTVSSVVLMFARGTAINKSFLVPLFALKAAPGVIFWIKSEYGVWTAFVALLVRLFFFIPGELELPFMALLFVIVAPHQVLRIRGTYEGAIISLAISAYLAFYHFSRTGNFRKAFEQGPIVATLAIVCITVVSFLQFL